MAMRLTRGGKFTWCEDDDPRAVDIHKYVKPQPQQIDWGKGEENYSYLVETEKSVSTMALSIAPSLRY